MATFSDIFDWLNQGAQGDVPGTTPQSQGGDQSVKPPPPSGAVQMPDITSPSPNQYPTVPQPQPQNIAAQQSPNASLAARIPQQSISTLGFDDLASLLSQYHMIATTPPGQNLSFDEPREAVSPDAFKGATQPSPQDYSGDIAPTLMGQYDQLIKNGIPPSVARTMLTEPSYGEGERPHSTPQYTPPQQYRGGEIDPQTGKAVDPIAPYADQTPNYEALLRQLWGARTTREQNLPTWEDHTPGEDDTLGLWGLPTEQYIDPRAVPPGLPSVLDYFRQQGDPSSFWWNPAPNSFEGQRLLNQQQAEQ